MWFFAFMLTLAALAGVHFRWRAKFRAQAERHAAELGQLHRRQQQATLDVQMQQKILFDSMLEGL